MHGLEISNPCFFYVFPVFMVTMMIFVVTKDTGFGNQGEYRW